MKKNTCGILIGILVLMIAAFAVGVGFSRLTSSYHYQVIDEKSEPFAHGKIVLRHVTEYVGWPIIVMGKNVIELERDDGAQMTLYKSQEGFQEGRPYVSEFKVHYNELDWEDGFHHYHLQVDPLPEPPGH